MSNDLLNSIASEVKGVASDYTEVRKDLTAMDQRIRNLSAAVGAEITNPRPKAEAGVENLSKHLRQVADLVFHRKAAADMTVDTDDRGGYLVPVTHQGSIDALMRPEGSLLARCQFHEAQPGQTYRVPFYSVAPTASFQLTEGGAFAEGDVQVGVLDVKSYACGFYLNASVQLLMNDDARAIYHFSQEATHAIRAKTETAIVAGEDGVDAPFDGLLQMSGTNSQSALATATAANLESFIEASISATPSLWDRGVIVTTPEVWLSVQDAAATTEYQARTGQAGAQKFGKWDVICTPAAEATTHRVMMVDPSYLHVARYGYSVLVDDTASISTLMGTVGFVAWYGFGCSLPGSVNHAVVTALS